MKNGSQGPPGLASGGLETETKREAGLISPTQKIKAPPLVEAAPWSIHKRQSSCYCAVHSPDPWGIGQLALPCPEVPLIRGSGSETTVSVLRAGVARSAGDFGLGY